MTNSNEENDDLEHDEIIEQLKISTLQNTGQTNRHLVRLMDRYVPMIVWIARRCQIDEAEIDDVIQETLLQVWRSAESFDRGRGRARNWIAGTARNKSVDLLRKRGRVDPLPEGWDIGDEDPHSWEGEEQERDRRRRIQALECAKERMAAAELEEIERRLAMYDVHMARRPTNAYRDAAKHLEQALHECYSNLFQTPYLGMRGT